MSGTAWQDWWQTLAEEFVTYGPGFLSATLVVLGVTVASILVSWVCGLLGALGKRSTFAPFRALASFYVWFIGARRPSSRSSSSISACRRSA